MYQLLITLTVLAFPHTFPYYITTPLCPLRMFEQSVNFTPQAGTQMQGDRTGKHMEKNMRNISFKPWRASREERERVVFRNNGLRDIIMIMMLQFSTIKIDNDGLSDRVR